MQNILEQLLKVVLALIALITAYLTGKGAITTQGVVQNAAPVKTQAVSAITQAQTAVTTPIVPSAPGGVSQQAQSQQAQAKLQPRQANAASAATANTVVSVAGVTSLNTTDTTATTVGTQAAVNTQVTTTGIITDNSAYGAGSYVAEKVVDGAIYVATTGADSNAGTKESPFVTVQKALDVIQPGQTVYIRGGTYSLSEQIIPQTSGTASAWITIAGYPGETVVLDFSSRSVALDDRDYGAILFHNGVSYIRLENVQVHNAQSSGISVCNAHHIDIIGNTTKSTFSSGINTLSIANNGCVGPHDVRILRNTVIDATNNSMAMSGYTGSEAPHEAISTMGVQNFEIAYNHIYDSNKEGIDVKENSGNGIVHHNLVENIARQCYYVDAGFGGLHDIEIYENIGRGCGFMGFALSSENPDLAKNISFHHNLLYNNGGNGIYISRFGVNGPRSDIEIYKNTVHNNGHGVDAGWIGGGLHLYTGNLSNAIIRDNIIVNNGDFQLGYATDQYGSEDDIVSKGILVKNNIINGPQNATHKWDSDIAPMQGIDTIVADPLFTNPEGGDFTLRAGSPAIGAATDGGNIGAF